MRRRNGKSLPIRKISRSYRVAIRYQLDGRPLTAKEIERGLRALGEGRGMTGVGVVPDISTRAER